MTDAGRHEIMATDVSEAVPASVLRSGLASADPIVRAHAAAVASNLPEEALGELQDLVPALADALDDDRRRVAFHATVALSLVAEERPELLEPAVPRLVPLLSHDLSLVRTAAARALGLVAEAHPGLLADHVGALLAAAARGPEDVLEPAAIERADFDYDRGSKYRAVNREARLQQARARSLAAGVVLAVAEHDPAALRPHVPGVVDLLAADEGGVASAGAAVLGVLARDGHRDAVPTDPLLDLLSSADDDLVLAAVAALGFVGDRAAAAPIRGVAGDAGRDEELRALAADTAAFLEDG